MSAERMYFLVFPYIINILINPSPAECVRCKTIESAPLCSFFYLIYLTYWTVYETRPRGHYISQIIIKIFQIILYHYTHFYWSTVIPETILFGYKILNILHYFHLLPIILWTMHTIRKIHSYAIYVIYILHYRIILCI